MTKKVGLVEVWLGKIPEYFQYHIETIGNFSCADFYFFTDDREYDFSYINHDNFVVNYIDQKEFLDLFNKTSEIKIEKIKEPKKIIDFKLSYFEMFSQYIKNYEYVGIYDIDTMFGDINQTIIELTQDYDFISVGDETYHNRLSGPLIIMKNKVELLDLIKTDRYYETLTLDEIYGYGEKELSKYVMENHKTKIIYSTNIDTNNGGKNLYESVWDNGKIFIENEERMLYHFYRKDHTTFRKIENKIYTKFDKKIVDDFCWVVHFSENYEKMIPRLIESIKKYSNRKCILYSINYFPKMANDMEYNSDQFIFKKIEIPQGKLDERGRDFNILTSKPLILMDAINSFPQKKFVHIDTDIYLTTNSDGIVKYFDQLENYPLANSHVHDVIFTSNVIPGEEWTSTLHILLREEEITKNPVYPRRKCNVIVFDEKSKWFFKEQMDLYKKYEGSKIPGILGIYDEDTFNCLLAKYELKKSLPLVDIEESYDLKIDKIHEYSYNKITSWVSPNLVFPESLNDFLFFHGFKDPMDYEKIKNEYGNKVLDCEELVIKYKDNLLLIEKNSFLTTKNDIGIVNFVVKDLNNNILFNMENQNLLEYWTFYISNFYLPKGKYSLELYKKENNHKIFGDIFEVK